MQPLDSAGAPIESQWRPIPSTPVTIHQPNKAAGFRSRHATQAAESARDSSTVLQEKLQTITHEGGIASASRVFRRHQRFYCRKISLLPSYCTGRNQISGVSAVSMFLDQTWSLHITMNRRNIPGSSQQGAAVGLCKPHPHRVI